MNTNIFQTIRVGIIVGIAFFAFASDALAAPMLTPVTVTRITENSATIIGHVSNPQKNSTVWFELFNNGGGATAVAVQGIWNEGTFEWNLRDLNAGQTYSYRSVAMEGGVTVYSPTSSFTALSPKPVSTTFVYQSNSAVNTTQTTTQAPVQKTVAATPAPAPVVKKEVVETPVVPRAGFTNGNAAAVIGAGNGMFPTTLIGWIILLISILVVGLIGRMIYESTEKHHKKDEKEEEEEETE
jgi:hypothetical protein